MARHGVVYLPHMPRKAHLHFFEAMERTITLAEIAEAHGVNKRAAQGWLKKAKNDQGDIGEIIGGTRLFNEEEKQILLSYAGAPKRQNLAEKKLPLNEVKTIAVIESEPKTAPVSVIPTQVSIEAIAGKPMGSIDLSSPQAVMNSMGQIRVALRNRVERSWEQYQATAATAQAFDNEMQQLQLEALGTQVQTAVANQMQTQAAQALEQNMGKFHAMAGTGNVP